MKKQVTNYVAPQIEVIEIELEGAILEDSVNSVMNITSLPTIDNSTTTAW